MNQNGADEGVATELALTAVNDYQMYRWAKSIIINYAQKRVKGTYNRELAIKGFVPIVEETARQYRREYGGIGRLSMATKRLAAAEILDHYEDEIREMTQKMQGVKDSGKPWVRRNAEGREWYSVAKKGKVTKKDIERARETYYTKHPVPEQPAREYITIENGVRRPTQPSDFFMKHIQDDQARMEKAYRKRTKSPKTSRKTSKKKPAASFGGISIGRVW